MTDLRTQVPSYFWGRRNIPLLYLLFPLLVVSLGFELILFSPKISPIVIEASMIVPSVVVGVFLLSSAKRFSLELAKVQPVHHLTRWNRVRTMYFVTLTASGLLDLYAIAVRGNILTGNFLQIFIGAFGIFYVANLFTMLLPLRLWSPKSTDFATMYVEATLDQTDAEVKYMASALHLFSSLYSKKTRLHLQRRVFTNASALDHSERRNLAFRLGHAIQSGDYEDGIHALMASINTAKESVLSDRRTLRDTLTSNKVGRAAVSGLAGLAALIVAYVSAVALGPSSVEAFRSEIGLLVVTVISIAAIVWASLGKA